ncbi:conserved hypothetical protein [Novosphingobium sp. PP1Y]|nr:conserved hypothetical protein [Novosphingobium sp. PP1Y]
MAVRLSSDTGAASYLRAIVPEAYPDLPYPANPDYGTGACRRRIVLNGSAGRVEGWLSDNFHEMTVTLEHDSSRVKRISGEMIRYPTTACPGASRVLDELVGIEVGTPSATLFAGGRARRNCTHLFDLAVLAVAHAERCEQERRYDILVPDTIEGQTKISVLRNQVTIHSWAVVDGWIVAPRELAGQPVGKGFAQWARELYSGDELEAALVLSRLNYLAVGRRWLTETFTGEPIGRNAALHDVCYAYSKGLREHAVFRDGARQEFPEGIPERD